VKSEWRIACQVLGVSGGNQRYHHGCCFCRMPLEAECRPEPVVDPSHHGRRKGAGGAPYVLGIEQFDVVAMHAPMDSLSRLNWNYRSDLRFPRGRDSCGKRRVETPVPRVIRHDHVQLFFVYVFEICGVDHSPVKLAFDHASSAWWGRRRSARLALPGSHFAGGIAAADDADNMGEG